MRHSGEALSDDLVL